MPVFIQDDKMRAPHAKSLRSSWLGHTYTNTREPKTKLTPLKFFSFCFDSFVPSQIVRPVDVFSILALARVRSCSLQDRQFRTSLVAWRGYRDRPNGCNIGSIIMEQKGPKHEKKVSKSCSHQSGACSNKEMKIKERIAPEHYRAFALDFAPGVCHFFGFHCPCCLTIFLWLH